MNVRIINKEIIKDEFSRLVKITRPIVQIKKSGAWVTVKEFLNYFKEEAESEAKKLYETLIKKKNKMFDNYPPGAANDPNAPYNQVDTPEKEFEVTCCQVLSRTVTVVTNDYIPGASGCDYEPDGEGGYCACGWQDDDDTSGTNWSKEYEENGYHTPLQLIQMLKDYLQKDLEKWQKEDEKTPHSGPAFHVRRLQHLIEECDGFDEDEIEFSL